MRVPDEVERVCAACARDRGAPPNEPLADSVSPEFGFDEQGVELGVSVLSRKDRGKSDRGVARGVSRALLNFE